MYAQHLYYYLAFVLYLADGILLPPQRQCFNVGGNFYSSYQEMLVSHFEQIRKRIIEQIDFAKSDILIAMYWFTNHELFDRLCSKLENGINVELIIYNDYVNNRSTGLNLQQFINLGGRFFFSENSNPIHHKFCIIDNKILINGSYNWTYFAEYKNSENILIVTNEDEIIKSFVTEFHKLKKRLQPVERILHLSQYELQEKDGLGIKDYLANDLIFQAKEKGNCEIAELAFKLSPNNITIQELGVQFNLTKKYRLTRAISISIKDGYLLSIPKNSSLPIYIMKDLSTSEDYQTSCATTIYSNDDDNETNIPFPPYLSVNKFKSGVCIFGLPPKPKGEAKMKIIFSVDINKNMTVKLYSLDNGNEDQYTMDIGFMTEELN